MVEPALPALLLRDQEMAVLELAEMMHDRDPRGVEFGRHLAHRATGRVLYQVENSPAGGVTQGIEHRGHIVHM